MNIRLARNLLYSIVDKLKARQMNKKILVVDDCKQYLEKLIEYFNRFFEVISESSLIKATVILEEQTFSAVISDIFLDDGLGLNLLEIVKSKSEDTLCIAISGNKEEKIKKMSNGQMPYDYFIRKPLDLKKLEFLKKVILRDYEKI